MVVLLVDNVSSWLTIRSVTPLSAIANKDRFSMNPSRWSTVPSVPWSMSVLGGRRVAALELPLAKGLIAPSTCSGRSCWFSYSI